LNQQIKVPSSFQNVQQHLIEKYKLDIYERYDLESFHNINLINSSSSRTNNYNNQSEKQQQQQQQHQRHHLYSSIEQKDKYHSPVQITYYYYDNASQNLMDINSIQIDTTTTTNINNNTNNSNMTSNAYHSPQRRPSSSSSSSDIIINYPLSFIDSVNYKQLDLETGYFRDKNTNKFTIRLQEAIESNLLNPYTAYLNDSTLRRTYDLIEALHSGLITNNNRILLSTAAYAISLADALKSGQLKLGEAIKYSHQQVNSKSNYFNF
jgi:hypothetical protein